MTRDQFMDLVYDHQRAERELAIVKATLEQAKSEELSLATRIFNLTQGMERYLEVHAKDKIVEANKRWYWVDPSAGICSQERLLVYDLPMGEPDAPETIDPATLTPEQETELAAQQAIADEPSMSDRDISLLVFAVPVSHSDPDACVVNEDSDIDAAKVAGVVVP